MTDDVRSIPGLPGYFAHRNGHIYSTRKNGAAFYRMAEGIDKDGYKSVQLTYGGKSRKYRVHRLVLRAWSYEPPLQDVRHLDGDRKNNCLENLAWGTQQDNANDRKCHGRTARGKTCSRKLTDNQVCKIKERSKKGESTYQLAKKFNVSRRDIQFIKSDHRKKHAT